MCGIAGIVSSSSSDSLRETVSGMTSFMQERGPDWTGSWVGQCVGLGHTRLSIIDLEQRSAQPFFIERDVVLVFNGEIYNFQELRAQLVGRGHSFATESDTEVLGRAYLEWGESFVGRLDGMFSFGIYDGRRNILILARDRFGKKPLYLYRSHEEVLFCSDIRAIEKVKRGSLAVNLDSIDYYLSEYSTPQPATIWKEIEQVEPATILVLDLSLMSWTSRTYWEIRNVVTIEDEAEALHEVETALAAAIRRRSFADVPLGCFLSGGVDSGLVVAMLAEQSSVPVKTFTMTLDGHPMDEGRLAAGVAQRYATEHTEIVVKPDFEFIAEKLLDYCGEPFADSSLIPAFFISKAISEYLTVALSGDGGDELFGGYQEYLQAYQADRFLRTCGTGLGGSLSVWADKALSRFSGRRNLGAAQEWLRLPPARKMSRNMGLSRDLKDLIWQPEARVELGSTAENCLALRWAESPSPWSVSRLMRASLRTRLLNDYLVKIDRASMMNSLEVRSPFLDTALAETAFKISPKLHFKGEQEKYLLKRLAQDKIDQGIFQRSKLGFSIPLHEWLRNDMSDFVDDLLLGGDCWIYSIFRGEAVKEMWRREKESGGLAAYVWALACLELWAKSVSLRF